MSNLDNPFQQPPASQNPYGGSPNPYAGQPGGPNPYGPGPGGVNPYAAPTSGYEPGMGMGMGMDQPLASRGTRFLGALLDTLIAVVFIVPPMFLFGGPEDEAGLIGAGLGWLLVMGIQWYLIATTGQSIAKRMLGMKIVKTDGSDVNFVSGVILRVWVIAALGAIPFVGNIVGLVDAVMIFGEEHRCLHDQIAGTKVISV